MRPPKKWKRGERIYTYEAFENAVQAKRVMFVNRHFRDRPVNAVVVANMSYSVVTSLIRGISISLAVQSEEYREWLRDELLGVPADRGLCLPRWESSLYDEHDDYEIVEEEEVQFS